MRLNLRRNGADTLTVPPSGERRLLFGLLALPVLTLDVVCALGVAAANEGGARTVLLAILGLCLVLTLITLTVGPGLVRKSLEPFPSAPPVQVRPAPVIVPVPEPAAPQPAAPERAVPEQRVHASPIGRLPTQGGPRTELVITAARRNQDLVARQEACLDLLARDGGGPVDVQAAVWRMGELSARLRRNSESLLVVAGAEPERRIRESMPLSEVIAAATAEIENGSRVSTTLDVDRDVLADQALVLVHLLAELLENATGYSFPASGVQVYGEPGPDGVRVRIEDSGPGFSEADLDRANRRLNAPDEVVDDADDANDVQIGALGLGLYVVGRLAQQLSCTVRMSRAQSGGVAVVVELPDSTFVPSPVFDEADWSQPPTNQPMDEFVDVRVDERVDAFVNDGRVADDAGEGAYAHYDDYTDLTEYTDLQGYADLPPVEPEPAPDPAGSFWQRPEETLEQPAALSEPVALDEPFGASASLTPAESLGHPGEEAGVEVPRRRGRREAVPQTFFNPIEPAGPEHSEQLLAESPADPLSHPPHPEPHLVEALGVPKQYPSRAELRRRRREQEEEAQGAMHAGAQAAAHAAELQAEQNADEPRSLLEEVMSRQPREAEPDFVIPSQVSPLDDPDFRVPAEEEPADLPPIPVQAQAPEDEPGFDVPPEAPATAPARPAARHAATGPVPMVSASRSSLSGTATVPGEATRQRATQVRSMLTGLRSGAEKARADSEAQTGTDTGVPQPRNPNQPEQ